MKKQKKKLKLLISCCLLPTFVVCGSEIAIAQIIPDGTLPNNSLVSPNGNGIKIDGGTTAGSNLFHSFQQFSVPTDATVFFDNRPQIQNIIGRVTGRERSLINGIIRANGSANLFLINPNGIVFGPNASLQIGGSFLSSTADSLIFPDGDRFSAANPQPTELLSVKVPIGLQMGTNPGSIVNQSRARVGGPNSVALPAGLAVLPGRTIALVGGDVTLDGGNLTALAGRIELGSAASTRVNIIPDASGWRLGYDPGGSYGNLQVLNGALADASNFTPPPGPQLPPELVGERSGEIQVRGGQILLDGGAIATTNAGSEPGGNLNITATDIELRGEPLRSLIGPLAVGLITQTQGTGKAGDLNIVTQRLTVRDGAQILTLTEAPGAGGNLTVNASESIEVIGSTEVFIPQAPMPIVQPSLLSSNTRSEGNAGNVTVNTERLTIQEGGELSVSTFSAGDAGNLDISADTINVTGIGENGSSSSILTGVRLSGPQQTPTGLVIIPPTTGAGGDLTIETGQLTVEAGGFISASTQSVGRAGSLTIRAREFIEVSGSTDDFGSSISTEVEAVPLGRIPEELVPVEAVRTPMEFVLPATGSGGNLTIETPQLTVRDGGQVLGSTAGSGAMGRGGDVTLNVDRLLVEGGGQILASTVGEQQAGTLTINATDSIEFNGTTGDGQVPSGAFVQSQGNLTTSNAGNAGDLTISTPTLTLRNGAAVSADTFADGEGGSVSINAGTVEISGRSAIPSDLPTADDEGFLPSRISAQTQGEGRGGNVAVSADILTVRDGAVANVSSVLPDEERFRSNPANLITNPANLGGAGNLNVSAPEIRLENRGSLEAETRGGRGNINLNTEDLRLRENSSITTNAFGEATGGNIRIDASTLTALNDSDISANAEESFGGQVIINATGLFGTEFRDASSTETSDITATSELGPEFSGIVDINTPDIDPTQGLVEFDEDIVDIDRLIEENLCEEVEGSQFTTPGRGGLPTNPSGSLSPVTIWEPDPPQLPLARGEEEVSERIVEAQGLIVNEDGQLELTTEPETVTPIAPWYVPPGCRGQSRDGGERAFLVSSRSSLPLFAASGNPAPTVAVEKFQVVGSGVFSEEELNEQLQKFIGREMTFAQLVEARSAITKLYTDNNYITSGAYIPPQVVENNTVKIQVVEGEVSEIRVSTDGNLNDDYIKSRLELVAVSPINRDRLLEGLQLLQLNPLIEEVKAELSEGIYPGTSVLEVTVEEVNPWDFEIISDNGRTPGVGTFQRGTEISNSNFLGRGDRLTLAYNNSDGSNEIGTSYTLPINPRNGTIQLSYQNQSSEIIEPPFDPLDIEADSETYQLTFRQPIVLKPNTEFALGLTASRRESQTSILGENFPLSRGANSRGETKLSTISFFQDWVKREENSVLAARSEFNLGLDAFDATVNNSGPDSRFFSWQGQAQFVQRLDNNNTLLLMRGNVQLTPDELVGLEQFGLGGLQSVRGYRQDARLTDNGVLGTVELRLPISWVSNNNRRISVVPFVDGGVGWNNGDDDTPTPNGLASVGLGLQANFGDDLRMRFDYAMPLVEIDSRDRTWQENGFYFSVLLNPF